MDVEDGELRAGQRYRDFVVYTPARAELFSARLKEGERRLQVMWTESIKPHRLLVWLRKVQELAGGPVSFSAIEGQASDKLQLLIKGGKFNAFTAGAALAKALGGKWRVVITVRPGGFPKSWDVTAIRLGDE